MVNISPFSIMRLDGIDKKWMVFILKFNFQICITMSVKFISYFSKLTNWNYLSFVSLLFAKFNPFPEVVFNIALSIKGKKFPQLTKYFWVEVHKAF
jgi:hypothetical protein